MLSNYTSRHSDWIYNKMGMKSTFKHCINICSTKLGFFLNHAPVMERNVWHFLVLPHSEHLERPDCMVSVPKPEINLLKPQTVFYLFSMNNSPKPPNIQCTPILDGASANCHIWEARDNNFWAFLLENG